MTKAISGWFCVCLVCFFGGRAAAAPNHVVLGYSAAWRDGADSPKDYDYAGLTYLCRAFLSPAPDGSISVPEGYFNPTMEKLARQNGVKLLMSLGGGSEHADRWISLSTHPKARQKFLDNLQNLLNEHHYDGIDVDWEPSPATIADGNAYTSLLKGIHQRFPKAILTTAVDTDEYAIKFTSWPEVVANVNYINVMAYDFSGPWSGVAGFATNLHPAGVYPAQPEHSVREGMENLLNHHHVPAAKMLLGMNFYAYRFRSNHIGDKFPRNAANASDALSYQEVLDLINTGDYQVLWDQKAAAPYLQRKGGGSVVVYDNPKTIDQKCAYAKSLNLAGMMIWDVGSDECGQHAPLMDAVAQSFGAKATVLGKAAMQRQVTDVANRLQQAGKAVLLAGAVSSLNQSQLKDAYAKLQRQWGTWLDQHWSQQGPALTSK